MAEAQRIESLKKRHETLERTLETERTRPMPDSAAIAEIKRMKLAIKDEMANLSS
ncbi:YdcH family protein [Nisaea sp.]|uniref:YdcH family protein n=1 Tax=Nisaea sp. TaxID=2024842 RepID=UPI003B526815